MNSEEQKRIAQRAYQLWEEEGQPHGKHEEHWRRAVHEIEAEEKASAAAKPASRRVLGRSATNSGRHSRQRRTNAMA